MIDNFNHLSKIGRRRKVALQILVDVILIVTSFILAMLIRLENLEFFLNPNVWWPFSIATATLIGFFFRLGLYRALMRFVTGMILVSVVKGSVVFAFAMFAINGISNAGIPRSVPFISAILIFLSIGGFRFLIREVFRKPIQRNKRSVIIYGAGGLVENFSAHSFTVATTCQLLLLTMILRFKG